MVHIDNGYSYNEHTLTCDTTNLRQTLKFLQP